MSIAATCPGCRSRYELPERLAGKRVRCHKCNEEFLARGPSSAAAEELAVALPADEPDEEPVVAELAVAVSPRRPPARTAEPPPARRQPDLPIQHHGLPVPVLVALGVAALLLVLGAGSLAVAWLWRAKSPAASEVAADPAHKDDAIPLKTLEEIKSATVFIKVESGAAAASGSGFVMRVDGDTGYVVTNHHVITPPEQPMFGPRPPFGRPPRFFIPGGPTTLTVVFWSGTPKEQSVRAAIAADDAKRDLAVLKVTGVANLPAPIDFSGNPDLVETMPVFLFGFPFGEALDLNKGNPAITVGKGSVSSLRMNVRGQVQRIQIDGDLNPGNSGGPVVDAKGRLIGVAVAKVTGTRIGLAIPPSELTKMLNKEPAD